MRFIYFIGVVLIASVAAFFFLNNYIYYEKQSDAPSQEADAPSLTSQYWTWEESLYNDGRRIVPRAAGAFTISFTKDGTMSVTTDCNSGFGTYAAEGDRLSFGSVGLTKKFCEGSQEQEFVGTLAHVSGYHFGPEGQLILDLKFDSGSVILR